MMGLLGFGGIGKALFGQKPNYSKVKTPYQQLEGLFPGLTDTSKLAEGNINSYLSGELPPDVASNLKNYGAAFGVASGMPGSGLSDNFTLRSLGLSSLNEMQQGQTDYLNFLTGMGSQMMPVSEQMQVANVKAAPSPAASGALNTIMSLVGDVAGFFGGGGSPGNNAATPSPYTSGGSYQQSMPSFDAGQPFNFQVPQLQYDMGGVGPSAGSIGGYDNTFNIDSLYG